MPYDQRSKSPHYKCMNEYGTSYMLFWHLLSVRAAYGGERIVIQSGALNISEYMIKVVANRKTICGS